MGENPEFSTVFPQAQRIRISDQLQNFTGSSSTGVLARGGGGYPLQNRRHFFIEISNIKYNLLAILITAIYP